MPPEKGDVLAFYLCNKAEYLPDTFSVLAVVIDLISPE